MKKLILVVFILNLNAILATTDVSLICVSSFDQQVHNLIESDNITCLADFVWGRKEVCYEGNPSTLVDLMNDEYFDNRAGYQVADASLNDDGSISYIGLDQRNFYSAERTLFECQN